MIERTDKAASPQGGAEGEITTVACVGAGVIGSGWAALFAARGCRVNVYDPSPAAERLLADTVGRAAQTLGVAAAAIRAKMTFTTDLEQALAGADFIQESAPESLALKQRLMTDIDRVARANAVIASSTSDFPISLLQPSCRHPERLLVGHPINPPYAVALVEVVGSPATSPAMLDRACAFYRSLGKRPLHLERETTGFLANRLQMAVTREALQMVVRGEATVEQVDAALMHGVGARFASVGLFGSYALNLRDPDPDRWLEHIADFEFGASLVHDEPFPDWTQALQQEVAAQWHRRLADPGAAALADQRDRMTAQIARAHLPERKPDRGPHPSFAGDYQDARSKFLDAAGAAGGAIESHRLAGHEGPDGKPLFMDVARVGPADADVVVLSLSGTHGAEGFNGSAAQVQWLSTHDAGALPPGVAMLFVHAVNPFGFAHMLRVNENNVDLNRNFMDFGRPLPPNPVYDAVAERLPRRFGLDEALVEEWDRVIADATAAHGARATAHALSCGQYDDPAGIEYGGDRLQWSSRTVIEAVSRLTAHSRHIVYLDWHSLIPIGDGTLIFISFNEPGDGLHRRVGSWWGEAAVDPATVDAQWAGGTSAPHSTPHGVLMGGLQRALAPRADVAGALVEFCCDPDGLAASPEPDTRTTMWERWLFATREHDSASGRMVTRYLREAASPTRRSYQDAALAAAMPVYRQAIEGAGRWAAENVAPECGRLIQPDAR